MNKLSILAFLFILFIASSCKKEYYTTEVNEIPNQNDRIHCAGFCLEL